MQGRRIRLAPGGQPPRSLGGFSRRLDARDVPGAEPFLRRGWSRNGFSRQRLAQGLGRCAQALMTGVADVTALEEFMTRPTRELEADLARAQGDMLVLGVGGKMGPTLARMAKRAAPEKRVIGVARFSEKGLKEKLPANGVECIACDLLDRAAVEQLPRADNVVFMAGHKFGAAGNPSFTWAMN